MDDFAQTPVFDASSGRPLRVVHLIKGLGPGGAERLVLNQIGSSTGGIDYEVVTVIEEKIHGVAEAEAAGARVQVLGQRGWLRRLPRELRHADVVHAHSPVMAAAARPIVAAMPSTAMVTTEHNRWPRHHPLTRTANRWTARLDDHRFAVSDDVKASMAAALQKSTEVLVHGVPLAEVRAQRAERDAVRAEFGIEPDDVAIGIVANFRPEKAHDVLIGAFERSAAAHEACRLVVVGQGPGEAPFRQRAAASDFSERIQVLGHRPDATRVMAGLDVFTLSSRHEGLPVALMEAMAIGLPSALTRAGGIPEAVRDGAEGLLVDVDDVDALADAYNRLVTEPDLRRRLGQTAATSASQFDASAATRSIESTYRRLASTRGDRDVGASRS